MSCSRLHNKALWSDLVRQQHSPLVHVMFSVVQPHPDLDGVTTPDPVVDVLHFDTLKHKIGSERKRQRKKLTKIWQMFSLLFATHSLHSTIFFLLRHEQVTLKMTFWHSLEALKGLNSGGRVGRYGESALEDGGWTLGTVNPDQRILKATHNTVVEL